MPQAASQFEDRLSERIFGVRNHLGGPRPVPLYVPWA